ncbi:MAG: hypothetical protein HDQ95_05280 [Roseburia sp.]|nr:hypothetical protein [Roseburia sp.]
MDKKMYIIYIIIILGITVGMMATVMFSGLNFTGILRYLATYFGLILISYVSYSIFMRNGGLNERFVKVGINIWLAVGVIQSFVSRNFCSNIVSNARTSSNRGVFSLASEPSFYGYMCVFFGVLVLEFQTKRIFYWLNLLFQVVFLAKSSVTVLYLIILFGLIGLYLLRERGFKGILIFFIALAGAVLLYRFLVGRIDSGQRMIVFLNTLFSGKNIWAIIKNFGNDGSIYIRFRDIWICIEGFVSYGGMPHGFNTRKISSGYGSMMYTMGWIGIIIIICIFKLMRSAYENKMARNVIPVFLTIILFSAIQISNPIIGFLVGYYMYKRRNKGIQGQKASLTKYSYQEFGGKNVLFHE